MSHKRIKLRPVATAVSFTEISPSKHHKRRKRTQRLRGTTLPGSEPRALEITCSPTRLESVSEDSHEFEGCSDTSQDATDTCSSQQARSYSKRQEKLSDAWSQIRDRLHTALIESSVPNLGSCISCSQTAVVICQQCGPQAVYCEGCTESLHLTCNIFHRPQVFQVKFLGWLSWLIFHML